MGSILSAIRNFFISILMAVGIISSPVASPAPTVATPSPSPTSIQTTAPAPQSSGTMFQTTGSYNTRAGTLNYTLNIPTQGGPITGSFSGVCTGSLNGTYSGGEGGSYSGSGNGDCRVGFISGPLTFQFSGKIYPQEKQATINYQGTLDGISRQGSQTLTLHSQF